MATEIKREALVRIHNEVKMARKRNESELEPKIRRNVARYTGVFVPEMAVDWDIVLNEVYPIIQFSLPSIFYRNPRVFLKPRSKNFIAKRRDPMSGEWTSVTLDSSKSAKTQEAILNYKIQEILYKKETRKTLFDALVATHGVLWHGYKGEFGMTNEQSIFIRKENVFVRRLSPLKFLFDPAVNLANLDEARWIGREFQVPLEDLLDDPKLKVDKKAMKGKLGFGEKVGTEELLAQIKSGGMDKLVTGRLKSLIDFTDSEFRNSNASKFVTLFEIFIRPTPKEEREGGKGQMILLSDEQTEPLRVNPWPYKAEGWPAKVLAFNELPDAMFPLDDISTYENIADNKNIIRNLQIRNAQSNSKIWVSIAKEGVHEGDLEKIQNGDQTIILYEGDSPANRVNVSSPSGGASQELYTVDQRIDRELQDKSGVTDLKRGFLQSGEESAASVNLRAAGGSVRPQYRQDIMSDFLKESLGYLKDLIRQFVPVDDAVRIVGSLDIEWSDNPSKEEIQADTDVELDVVSMLPENPEKEVQESMTVLKLMTEALNNPALYQKLQTEGYTFNIAPILENILMRLKIRNPEVFRRIRQEESMGFVSVAELKATQANVMAVMKGEQAPSPPAPGQDHKARIDVYTTMAQVFMETGNPLVAQLLQALAQLQAELAAEEEKKNAPKEGQPVDLPAGVGADA